MASYKETIRQQCKKQIDELNKLNIIFEPSENWANYGHLSEGHALQYTSLDEIFNALPDAKEALASGDYDSLQEALDSYVSESAPEIEVCSDKEWLRVYGNYEPDEDTGNNEIDEESFRIDCSNMEDAFPEADFVAPRGNRSMCHQWNGAGFTHRTHGHGTFDTLTETGEKLWDSI